MLNKSIINENHFINIRQLIKLRYFLDRQIIIEYKKINKIEKKEKNDKITKNA